jgi:hypothetical protein
MCKEIVNYFSSKKYQLHLFRLFGFSNKDYATFKILSTSKKRNSGWWFFNNLYFPLMVIVSPIILTIVHNYYNTVAYNKSFIEIIISGSLTLLGINIVRTASTAIGEKLDGTNIPAQLKDQIDSLIAEIDSIKSKLDRRVWFISFFGWGLYLLQIGQFVNNSHSFVYVILLVVIILAITSVLYGRFIYLMKTNIFDREEVVTLLFGKLLSAKDDFTQLESVLQNQGL